MAITITVNGSSVDYAARSYRRTDNLESRNSASFRFFDRPPSYPAANFEIGHPVVVSSGLETLFSGTVNEMKRELPVSENPASPNVIIYSVKAVDYTQLLDRFLVFGSFQRDLVEVEITWSQGWATVTETGHEFTTGDSVEVEESDDADLDGVFIVTKIDEDQYKYQVGNPFILESPSTAKARRLWNVYDAIVRIVDDLTPLKDEGVTTTGVINDRSLVLSTKVFDRKLAKQAITDICDEYDLVFWIDDSKVLNVLSSATNAAPSGFGEGALGYSRVKVTEGRKDYRNVQYLSGGKAAILPRVETHTMQGDDKRFDLHYDIGARPKIEESTDGVNFNTVSPIRLGIRDADDEDLTVPPGKKKNYQYRWFWSRGQKTIAFNNNIETNEDDLETGTFGKLNDGDIVRVSYTGLQRILVRADDINEQLDRAAIEGGTGIYEDTSEERDIEDADAAARLSEKILSRHGRLPVKIEIGHMTSGFRSGQTIPIDFPKLGVKGDYLITSVDSRDLSGDGETIEYSMTIEPRQRPRSLFEFWRQVTRDKEIDLRSEGQRKLHTMRKGVELHSVGEVSVAVDSNDEVVDISTDFGSIAVMGSARMGSIYFGDPLHVT